MTVAVNDTIERYVIAGAGPYAYTWRIFNVTDLQVYALSTASPPVPTLLTHLTHYTVAGANEAAGGSITLTAAAIAAYTGFTLDIRANTPRSQPTSIRNQARFLPEIHEDAFDCLDRQIQDMGRLVDAGMRSPDNEPALAMILPPLASRIGKYGTYDVNGQPSVASGTGNDSALRTDLAAGIANLVNANSLAYVRTALEILAAVVPTDLSPELEYDVTRWGADPTGATSSQAAFDKARAVAVASGKKVKIKFPAGTYTYATSPNWAIQGLTLEAVGEVQLNFTGVGNAWVFDAGAAVTNIYNVRCLGNFIVNGTATATNGFFVRGVHHSIFEGKVKNVSAAGCQINFSVASTFRIKTTVDSGSFTTTPVNGYLIQGRAAGEYTAWCSFYDTVIDSCSGFGVDILHASGCSFYGGFAEFSGGSIRIQATNLCQHNTFYSFDSESNTTYDVEIHGQHNRLIGCTSFSNAFNDNLIIGADAVGTQIIGGYHKVCTLQAGSLDTLFLNASFANTGGGITGAGKYRAIGCYLVNPGTSARTAGIVDVYGDSATFTPTLIGSTTAGVQTYTAQVGFYRKIGDLVHFHLFVAISAKGGTIAGDVTIGGLPFSLKNTANLFANCAIGDYGGLTNAAGRTQFLARGAPGTPTLRIIEAGSAVASQAVPVASLAASSFLAVSGTYLTD
jgi:hypothetical protein